jgi:hypothetical protein
MKKDKKTRLERAGWKVGTVRDLLGLSKAEEALVELKLILSHGLRGVRPAQVTRHNWRGC